MFIRKIKSRNSICFQIGEKREGRFKLVKHVGCTNNPLAVELLRDRAKKELANLLFKNQISLFPNKDSGLLKAKLVSWQITGFYEVFGRVYDQIGFPDDLLKDFVIGRIVYPKSKLSTIEYLNRYLGKEIVKDQAYRFLDTLKKRELTNIAFYFVAKKQARGISLIFYDVTTLSFETDREDEMRKKGYSKSHRNDLPQILLGLFVDYEGYPFDFDFFAGSTYEGHTFSLSIENIINKYKFNDLTVVADAGMLSHDNLEYLDSKNINYIVGGRIKNMEEELTQKIIANDFTLNPIFTTNMPSSRLIVEFKEDRAKKDAAEREKTIEKLKLRLDEGKPVVRKSKYLSFKDKALEVLGIDKDKIAKDKKFDGLKTYLTNLSNSLSSTEIINQYKNLWQVEKAFRMAKSDLKERPVFHWIKNRIEAHLLICFAALLVIKETEKVLKLKNFSLKQAIEILGKVGRGYARIKNIQIEIDSELNEETESLLKLFKGH